VLGEGRPAADPHRRVGDLQRGVVGHRLDPEHVQCGRVGFSSFAVQTARELDGEALGLRVSEPRNLNQQFLYIAIRETVAQVPAGCQNDHLGWTRNPANAERCGSQGQGRAESLTLKSASISSSINASAPIRRPASSYHPQQGQT
jgi:hypothetical protein